MDISDLRDQFGLRYYEWALGDSAREVAEGFPLLRLVEDNQAARILEVLESLPGDELGMLSRALVKRFHARRLASLGLGISARGRAVLESSYAIRRTDEARRNTPPGNVSLKIDRARLRTLIRQSMHPLFGKPAGRVSASVWWYSVQVNGWQLKTWIDTGSQYFQLSYSHTIDGFDAKHELLGHASILSWLGISGQTNWQFINDETAPIAADSLVKLCSHFASAAPGLLAGLEAPRP